MHYGNRSFPRISSQTLLYQPVAMYYILQDSWNYSEKFCKYYYTIQFFTVGAVVSVTIPTDGDTR